MAPIANAKIAAPAFRINRQSAPGAAIVTLIPLRQFEELREIDVPAGYNRDDRPLQVLAANAAATESAPAPSAMTRAFSASKRMARLVSSSVTTIEPSTTGRIRPHIRGKTLFPPEPSTNVACQCGKTEAWPRANESAPGASLRLGTVDAHVGLARSNAGSDAGNEAAPTNRGDDGLDGRQILDDLQAHRRIARDEVVVVEGVNEGSIDTRKRAVFHRLPTRRTTP